MKLIDICFYTEEESEDEDGDVKINYKPQPILEPKVRDVFI